MSGFDLAQTVYMDADAVQQAELVYITSVKLYFYAKPVQGKTSSGISEPGVSLYVTSVDDTGAPVLDNKSIFHTYGARMEYGDINVSTTGATATTFTFRQPIPVNTGKRIAFLVSFDGSDNGFKLWCNKAGENVLGTTTATSVTSGKVDGHLFRVTNGNQLTPQLNTDLSFVLNVAKFTTTPTQFKIRNRAYEILRLSSISGSFKGGEPVYEHRSSATGNVIISSATNVVTGNGTSFNTVLAAGDKFVLTDGTDGNTDVRGVVSITNATHMVIDELPTFTTNTGGYFRTVTGSAFYYSAIDDHLIIQDSTANASVYLSNGAIVKGVDSLATATVADVVDRSVNAVQPAFFVVTPAGATVNTTVNFANSSFTMDDARATDTTIGKLTVFNSHSYVLASRSTEVTAATPFDSFEGTLTFTTANPYVTPYVREENLDLFVDTFTINNDTTNEYRGQGNASTRYVSKGVVLSNDQLAEDIKVYVRAYRPVGSDVKDRKSVV